MNGAESTETGVQQGHEKGTASELNTVLDTAPRPRGIKALAHALGASRTTIYGWLDLADNLGKEGDGSFDPEKWRAFAQSLSSKSKASQSDDKAALQAEELWLKNERLRNKIGQENGQWTRNDELELALGEVCTSMKTILRGKLERELPALFTDDPTKRSEVHKLGCNLVDELCTLIAGLATLFPGAAGPAPVDTAAEATRR